jgi:tRNA uridine 5-carboxymethylaminomethyl modification enzyme
MFTSRSEYRLSLRPDNADMRLTMWGAERGIVSTERIEELNRRKALIADGLKQLHSASFSPHEWTSLIGVDVSRDGRQRTAFDMLKQPRVSMERLEKACGLSIDFQARDYVYAEALYSDYLARQVREVASFREDDKTLIPRDFDFSVLAGLSSEEVEKLTAARPPTIASAARISGVTPSSLFLLVRALGKSTARQ